jgi:hypothetical protein
MRNISALNITAQVQQALNSGKSWVAVEFFADPRILNTFTVGKDHNQLSAGHYLTVDHATTGELTPLSIRIVPAGVTYKDNPTVDAHFIGHVLGTNDSAACFIFSLAGNEDKNGLASYKRDKELSWAEQDAGNS